MPVLWRQRSQLCSLCPRLAANRRLVPGYGFCGLFTTLHYADSLASARDSAFRLAYAKTFKLQPDVYAVQGYDAAQMLGIGLNAVKGDISKKAEFAAALKSAKIDSPRGSFTLGKNHNPVQDVYLRQVVGKENKVVSVASKALADP
ncbi:MAG: hypothetical protein EB006_10935, partial [Betaproteobacteria bacterium]|nr:hypothetical protein [Betaproteobacteria bacterium]